MRSVIFVGLAAMAFAPALAQTQPNSAPTTAPTPPVAQAQPGESQMQSQPGQMQAGATPADPGQMAATTGNQVVAGDVTSQLMTGAKVFDTKGGEVGTIEEVKDAMVVISTGTAKATLANTAFARGSIGPVIAMTKAQVEDAVKKAQGTGGAAGTPSAR
jgi:preprotein translocase subunit YajC